MADEQLVAQAQSGDQEALMQLWDQNRGLVYVIARRYAGRDSAYDMDDLMQTAFLGFCKALNGFDPAQEVPFMGYAQKPIRTAIRRFIGLDGRVRADHGAVSLDAEIAEGLTLADTLEDTTLPGMDELAIRSDEAKTVREAVGELPDPQRDVVQRFYFDNVLTAEIAQEINLPRPQVEAIRRRALQRLRMTPKVYRLWDNGDCYRHKGVAAFKSSWSSVVEDLVLQHERRRGELLSLMLL